MERFLRRDRNVKPQTIYLSNHQTLIPYMPHICQTMYKRFGIISAKPWFVKYLSNVLCRKNCQIFWEISDNFVICFISRKNVLKCLKTLKTMVYCLSIGGL